MLNIKKTKLKGCYEIQYKRFVDKRGHFQELYHYKKYSKIIKDKFVQDNFSRSKKNVLRGLHFQLKYPQSKLVSVVKGVIFDVAVDLRVHSKTFGMWHGVRLSEFNKKQLYIPRKFAHGFLVLSNYAEVLYKCSNYYDRTNEMTLCWNDKDIKIKWPIRKFKNLILSKKDLLSIDFNTFKNLKKF